MSDRLPVSSCKAYLSIVQKPLSPRPVFVIVFIYKNGETETGTGKQYTFISGSGLLGRSTVGTVLALPPPPPPRAFVIPAWRQKQASP